MNTSFAEASPLGTLMELPDTLFMAVPRKDVVNATNRPLMFCMCEISVPALWTSRSFSRVKTTSEGTILDTLRSEEATDPFSRNIIFFFRTLPIS